jgi:mannose-1-phosphate guanylyltransferase
VAWGLLSPVIVEETATRNKLCGIVFESGDGDRLRLFSEERAVKTSSMLEHTWNRVEKLIPAENVYTTIAEKHLRDPQISFQLSSRQTDTVIVQPEEKNTEAGLLLTLMYLRNRYPNATIATFPSNHFIREASRFMRSVDIAAEAIGRDPRRIVILGVVPRYPDTQYGYILPEKPRKGSSPLAFPRVAALIEKPDIDTAKRLIRSDGLWNTMTVLFNAKTILDLMRKEVPELHAVFQYFGHAIGTRAEKDLLHVIYADLPPISFGATILQPLVRKRFYPLHVITVRNVFWRDRRVPERVANTSSRYDYVRRLRLK